MGGATYPPHPWRQGRQEDRGRHRSSVRCSQLSLLKTNNSNELASRLHLPSPVCAASRRGESITSGRVTMGNDSKALTKVCSALLCFLFSARLTQCRSSWLPSRATSWTGWINVSPLYSSPAVTNTAPIPFFPWRPPSMISSIFAMFLLRLASFSEMYRCLPVSTENVSLILTVLTVRACKLVTILWKY